MGLLLLDTNIVSYQINRHPYAVFYEPILVGHSYAVSFQTVAELRFGARRVSLGKQKIRRMNLILGDMLVLHTNDTVCEHWIQVRLARQSRPTSAADAWIAATAMAFEIPLVTHNPSDFDGIAGLSLLTA
jgi:predicted nucleic acid-binding protein